MAPSLPIEVVELMLSNLRLEPETSYAPNWEEIKQSNKANIAALGQCALVCRLWAVPSRGILFRTLTISEKQAYAFQRLFPSTRSRTRRPTDATFPPYVRELRLSLNVGGKRWMQSTFQKSLNQHFRDTVKVLRLEGHGAGANFGQTKAENSLGFTFSGLVRLEIVGAWSFARADVFRLIGSLDKLEDLVLSLDNELVGDASGSTTNAVPPPTLRRVAFSKIASYPIFEWVKAFRPDGLEALQLYLPNQQHISREFLLSGFAYIAQLGSSLESLGLGIYSVTAHPWSRHNWSGSARSLKLEEPPFLDPVSTFLRVNRRLRHLSLDICQDYIHGRSADAQNNPGLTILRRLCASANASGALKNLESLTLRYNAEHKTLDSTLAQLPTTCRLVLTGPLRELPLCSARGMKIEFKEATYRYTEEFCIF
ncbi:BHLH domain-containing protein [Mycena chlorophos]|uniref:BHLH domain-containing protein n=1 Tax=Mycena chlorophos TaxID=658473 RepID=A0A8H6TLI1_MYCCL|nr:BHLH domain-containing protein [Mycena chlorophos]